MSYDLSALREIEFPWATRGDAVYLNNASTGPLPTRTVAAQNAFTQLRAEPFRLGEDDQFAVVRRARELSARLIGAQPREIALMTNTTYGINLAARALSLGAGDVVLTYDGEFPANIYPWMALEQRGVSLVRIPLEGGVPDEDALVEAMDRPGVRVVAVSWVQFSTGAVANLARLGRECRARGIRLVVDAIQGIGALQLDVHECEIDILACGGQKWLLSPWGTGFAYVREELASRLEPAAVGWLAMAASEDFTRLTNYEFRYWPDARRFEVFTLPFQDFAGFNASLELLLELGPRSIDAHVRALGRRIVSWATSRAGVRLVTPSDPARRGAIISVAPADPADASRRLTEAGIWHSLREGAIRLAPHAYNTESEVDSALEVLEG
jgi:selenocysteine lyase/cysteine desulfurase